jgi:hypothetical protein
MIINFDVLCFLEYYADRDNITDPVTGLRTPTGQWQNFYQVPQTMDIDPNASGKYAYLPFNPQGFGSCLASAMNDLDIELVAAANIVDITEDALLADNLVIAYLYVQDAGQDSFDASSAFLVSRYIGSIMEASISETSVTWTVNPGISKLNAQVPTRKITADMLDKWRNA